MIPFIKLFGLNIFSVRLPMIIISYISLIIFYLLLKEICNKKLAILGLFIFAICPWHIMKSRWGLESNLFPDFILSFIYFLILGLKRKNKLLFYISFIIAGISAYSYGTSYLFLPSLIVPLLIWLVYKKEITLKQCILSFCIITVITLPLILFVIINTFNLPQINLPFMTIPRLTVNRFEKLTVASSGNFFATCFSNLFNSITILIAQYDNLPWNAIYGVGTTYLFSILFFIIGIICSIFKNKINNYINSTKQKNQKDNIIHNNVLEINYSYIFKIWFIVCILLMLVCEPNINRLNIVFIPIIYYITIGIYFIIHISNYKKIVTSLITIIYLISFSYFIVQYFNQDWDNYSTFENNLEEVIGYVDKLNKDEVHVTFKIKEPYIYTLFYTKYPSEKFHQSVKYYRDDVEFRQVKYFGNYYFETINPENIININNKNSSFAYIILKNDFNNFKSEMAFSNFRITEFEKYVVIENR